MNKDLLCDIMPIMEKAAPIISTLLNNNKLSIILGLLALLVNCNPIDEQGMMKNLKEDPDLYAKLANLELTHSLWLNQL
jgi:hypothetical protein